MKATASFILLLSVLSSVSLNKKKSDCKPIWFNKCSRNSECCSKNCEKEQPNWQHGICGPSASDLGSPNECKQLWFKYCKKHEDCCSRKCVKESKEWAYGYCGEHEEKIKDEKDEQSDESACGVRKARRIGGRIVGGSPAIRNEFPWQVGIEFDEVIRGGGTIINDRWILTAAHVFNGNVQLDKYRGIIGTVSIDEAPVYVFFDELIIHPQFQSLSGDLSNDIALLHTTKAMTLYPKWNIVNSACLPEPDAEYEGVVTVSGWGNINDEGTSSDRLMAVDLQIQSDEKCENEYQTRFNKSIMICAGKPNGGKDSCVGDSGGPMVHLRRSVATVVGIVSFGPADRSCGRKGSAAVYTKVSKYIDWIKSSIRAEEKRETF